MSLKESKRVRVLHRGHGLKAAGLRPCRLIRRIGKTSLLLVATRGVQGYVGVEALLGDSTLDQARASLGRHAVSRALMSDTVCNCSSRSRYMFQNTREVFGLLQGIGGFERLVTMGEVEPLEVRASNVLHLTFLLGIWLFEALPKPLILGG